MSAECPYCGGVLAVAPKRRAGCKHCKNTIFVRRGQLVTEKTKTQLDAEWTRTHLLQRFNISDSEFESERCVLLESFKTTPSDRDVVWGVLNTRVLELAERGSPHDLKVHYYQMALFLDSEGREPFRMLEQSRRFALLHYSVISGHASVAGVAVIAAPDSCDECKGLDGLTFTLEAALATAPLPHRRCQRTLQGRFPFCRCDYSPGVMLAVALALVGLLKLVFG